MNNVATIEEFILLFHETLKKIYSKEEIDAMAFLTLNEVLDLSRDEVIMKKKEWIQSKDNEKLLSVLNELKTCKPIQYILGKTDFYGCKIRVNEHVLIPRPETEELVDLIINEVKNTKQETSTINILDIGTGSGCIAIALKKNLPFANISAIDVSDEALLVAKANAILNQTKISFLQANILDLSLLHPDKRSKYQVIVSNPPYIRLSEKGKMGKNVLDYEPHLALFVNDNEPLLFYNAIADFAKTYLTPDHNERVHSDELSSSSPLIRQRPLQIREGKPGTLYFEINEALGKDVKKMLKGKGFKNIELKKDLSGKERMLSTSL